MGMNLGGLAGGLASGFAVGSRLAREAEDQKWQAEQRDRQRKEWADEDAVGQAFAGAMQNQQPAGLEIARPQMTPDPNAQPAVPGVEAPQMTPAPQQAGLNVAAKPVSEESNMKRVLEASQAAMSEAAKRGNWQMFAKHFNTSASVRDNLRTRAMDNADRQFAMTGDWNAYVQPYNDFVADGNKIDSIKKNADGSYTLTGEMNGEKVDHPVPNDAAMKSLVSSMTDPAAMRKLEAMKAIKEFEILGETQKAVATERAKAMYREKDPRKDFLTLKGADGEGEAAYRIGDNGSLSPVGLDAAGGPKPLPSKVANDVRHGVESIYKSNGMNIMDPATQAKVGNAMTYGSALIAANKGSEGAAYLDVNTAAKIGADLADGKLKETTFADKNGHTWRGVEWNGKKLLLDQTPVGAKGVAMGSNTKGAGTRQTSGPITDMRIDPSVQAERDQQAGKLMINEYGSEEAARGALGELDKSIANAKGDAKSLLIGERNRLAAGLGIQQKGGVASLPAGAKQIGTSGGKPVYQTPDGKKFIQE